MSEVTAADAARNLGDLLDAVEQRGERFAIVRGGKVVARLEPASRGRGSDVKQVLADHPVDTTWSDDMAAVRQVAELQHRP